MAASDALSTSKEVFFFIGSGFGIVSFLLALLAPLRSANVRRWEAFTERLTEQDLIDLSHDAWEARRIPCDLLNEIHAIVQDFENDVESLKFGPLFRKRFAAHLAKIAEHYHGLRELVRNPAWIPERFVGDDDGEDTRFEWRLQKEPFYEAAVSRRQGDERYLGHLKSVDDGIRAIRHEYRGMSILANLHLVELPLAGWKLRRRKDFRCSG